MREGDYYESYYDADDETRYFSAHIAFARAACLYARRRHAFSALPRPPHAAHAPRRVKPTRTLCRVAAAPHIHNTVTSCSQIFYRNLARSLPKCHARPAARRASCYFICYYYRAKVVNMLYVSMLFSLRDLLMPIFYCRRPRASPTLAATAHRLLFSIIAGWRRHAPCRCRHVISAVY